MARAEVDDFVIYQYEWHLGGPQLGPYGERHLLALAKRLPESPFPVIIEQTPDPRLNEARRATVLDYFARHGLEVPPERVLIGFTKAEGLYGQEAPALNDALLGGGGGLRRGGTVTPAGGSFGGFRGGYGNFGGGGFQAY
jgi:hypothetical protein